MSDIIENYAKLLYKKLYVIYRKAAKQYDKITKLTVPLIKVLEE